MLLCLHTILFMYENMKYTMITTAPELAGYEIKENLGIVTGLTVRSTSMMGGIIGWIQSLAGGNVSTYTKLCKKARRESFELMYKEAIKLRANAIIAVKYDANEVAGYMTEVLSYGTAVKVEPKKPQI